MNIAFQRIKGFYFMIKQYIKLCIKGAISKQYDLILDPNTKFKRIFEIKKNTWEDSSYPACYMHSQEQHLKVFKPAEYIYEEKDATVFLDSDVVLTDKGVYWYKYNQEEFLTWYKGIPDLNVLSYRKEKIRFYKYFKTKKIEGKVLSLIGVWSSHWGHFMFQYLPKFFYACEAGFFYEKISILVPYNIDHTMLEIIKRYLNNYPKAKLIFAEPRTNYVCETLYFAPAVQYSWVDYNFRIDYTSCLSERVENAIRHYVALPLIEKVKNNKMVYEKIFLGRPATKRTLTNFDEIHKYFMNLGFVDIDPATLSLEEKADIFYHAKIVVGLFGSSFFNLIFGNNTKCLCLTNFKFMTENSYYNLIRNNVSKYINVTGQDENSSYHTNFYISLDKVKSAYTMLISEKTTTNFEH